MEIVEEEAKKKAEEEDIQKPGHGVRVSGKGGRGLEFGISLAARSLPVPGTSADGEKAYFYAIRRDAYLRVHPETANGAIGNGRG